MDAPIIRFDRYSQPSPHILTVGPRVLLAITRGRVVQRLRPVLGRVFLIGTANDCDLVLGDLTFPEAYAYLFVQGTKVTIRWLGAGPELVVCDEPVETAELLDGDRVAFGPFELQVSIGRPVRNRPRQPGLPGSAGAEFESADMHKSDAQSEVSSLSSGIRQFMGEDDCVLDLMDDEEYS